LQKTIRSQSSGVDQQMSLSQKKAPPTPLQTPKSPATSDAFPSPGRSRRKLEIPSGFDFFAHGSQSRRSSLPFQSPQVYYNSPGPSQNPQSPQYSRPAYPQPRTFPLPYEPALNSLLSTAESTNRFGIHRLPPFDTFIRDAAIGGLPVTGNVSWPFTSAQEACLMRYFVDNLAPWVSRIIAQTKVRR